MDLSQLDHTKSDCISSARALVALAMQAAEHQRQMSMMLYDLVEVNSGQRGQLDRIADVLESRS